MNSRYNNQSRTLLGNIFTDVSVDKGVAFGSKNPLANILGFLRWKKEKKPKQEIIKIKVRARSWKT